MLSLLRAAPTQQRRSLLSWRRALLLEPFPSRMCFPHSSSIHRQYLNSSTVYNRQSVLLWNRGSLLSRHPIPFTATRTRLITSVVAASKTKLPSSNKNKNASGPTSILVPIVGGLLITSAAFLKYFHDHVGGTEGLKRSIIFYSFAIPKYVVYRYYVFTNADQETFDEMDRKTAAKGLEYILDLQGFYTKCGQLVASNIGNAFPKIWQETMSILEDQVPAQEWSVMRDVLNEDWLGDHKLFLESIEEDPIGAASIGQVHRAILRPRTTDEKQQPVVVKIRYPNVEHLLRGDVRTIKAFCEVAQPVHVPGLNELERQLQTEFDYREEGAMQEKIRNNLAKAGLLDTMCQIPKVYPEYCTRRILVMDELKGGKLADELKKDMAHHAARANMSVDEYIESQRMKAQQFEQEKGERLQGPSREDYDVFIGLVDAKRRVQNAYSRLYNSTLGWIPGVPAKKYQDKSILPLNHAKLVDDLLYIHGHEVLVDGCWNADPHPGNCLLCRTEDGSPQLGLIDYGQVKTMTREQRHLFCKLMIALDDDDRDEIICLMKQAGFKSKNMDPEVIYLYAKVGYDQDSKKLTNGLHIQMFMEELQRRDPIIELPTEYILASRATLILRGLAHALQQSRSVAKSWRPIAERVLRENL